MVYNQDMFSEKEEKVYEMQKFILSPSWHGRMLASRGVMAGMNEEQLLLILFIFDSHVIVYVIFPYNVAVIFQHNFQSKSKPSCCIALVAIFLCNKLPDVSAAFRLHSSGTALSGQPL